ncbi:hypothetical protein ACFL1K_05055 [Candidatus Omnitrophota bacterium]
MRAKEIYDGLAERWGKICNDEAWISSIKKDYSMADMEWTPDRFFLITNSWGPWHSNRQMEVWNAMKSAFPEVANDIRKARQDFKGFPLPWQNERVKNISEYLKRESKTFEEVIIYLRSLTGLQARDYLAEILGAGKNKKTISCFIRDFLFKDTLPIDSRVSEMLSCLGLPSDEDEMVRLCEMDGVPSRILDRMLYMQWDECPDRSPGPNNECGKCKINNYCWEYILK